MMRNRGSNHGWNALAPEDLAAIEAQLRQDAGEGEAGLSSRQLLALRGKLRTCYNQRNYRRVVRIPSLVSQYDSGVGLLKLAEIHQYPALELMRIVLKKRGLKRQHVTAAINDPVAADAPLLRDRDRVQIMEALASDQAEADTRDRQIGLLESASAFENVLCEYFESRGVSLYREAELKAKQRRAFGAPVLTPDLLLRSAVTINGAPVAWVDAKNTYGSSYSIVDDRKQLRRYTAEWGPGAVVYAAGFCGGVDVDDILLLDGSTMLPRGAVGRALLTLRANVRNVLGSVLPVARPPELSADGDERRMLAPGRGDEVVMSRVSALEEDEKSERGERERARTTLLAGVS